MRGTILVIVVFSLVSAFAQSPERDLKRLELKAEVVSAFLYRVSTEYALEVLAKSAGITIRIRTASPLPRFSGVFEKTPFEAALREVLESAALDYEVIDAKTLLITPKIIPLLR